MNLVEFKDLPCDAVAAQHDVVAFGEGQVGHAAETEADGAVDCGAGVLAQVLPQALLLLLGLGAAVQQQEDVAVPPSSSRGSGAYRPEASFRP